MAMQGPALTISTTTFESYQAEVKQLLDTNLAEQNLSEALRKKLATQKSPSEHLLFIAEMIEQYVVRHQERFSLKGLKVVNAFLANLPYETLIEQLSGAHESKSALWLLAYAAAHGKPETFLAVWEKSEGHIPARVLLKEVEQGPHKGINALWWIARAAADGKPEAFLAVWQKLSDKIPLEILLKAMGQDVDVSKSIIWLLACGAAHDKPEAFLAVWEKLGGHIPAEALLKEAQQGIDVLWCLANAAAHGKPEAFLAVWEKVKEEINLADLLKAVQEGPHVGKDALGWLVQGALPLCPPTVSAYQRNVIEQNAPRNLQVVTEALTQLSGLLPDVVLQQDNPLGKLLREESLLRLSEARNSFFIALEAYQQTDSKKNEKNVWKKAQEALKAGYLNAFYDLGNHYFTNNEIESGFAAYVKVPADSWQYSRVMDQLCAHHFGKIMLSPTEKKLQHLEVALGYALKTTGKSKEQHIQMLAAQYFFDFKLPMNVPKDLVPPHWLALMGSNMSAEMGLKALDELKTLRALEKQKQALQEQLAQKEQELQEQLAQHEQARAQFLAEKKTRERENEQLKQGQAQPVGSRLDELTSISSQSQLLPQFSVEASRVNVGRGKELRKTRRLSADLVPAGEDEQPPKKMKFGNPNR